MGFDVVVIGSVNNDVSVMTPRLPRPGETVVGTSHFFGPGGKGANQAVAVARLGARVGLIALVGADEWGEALLGGLGSEGVDVSMVGVDPDAASGLAVITIDSSAENTIVASPGANRNLTPSHIDAVGEAIADARVVLAQLEVPVETVAAAAAIAEGTFCLNPAPAARLPAALMGQIDLLIPNRTELSVLTGADEVLEAEGVPDAARSLGRTGPTVVTLGADGAMLIDGDITIRFPSHPVDAVDPTGAGDAFCGALAFSTSRGDDLEGSIAFATAAGALAVTRPGAQSGMPTLDQVEALLRG